MADFVLLLGVDDALFKTCFGEDSLWSPWCELESLPEDCAASELTTTLERPGLKSVVIDDTELPYWDVIKKYYESGGLVVFFGIMGEFSVPSFLSQQFGLTWSFSAYTTHKYVLTPVGIEILGDAVTEQQYTKSNLISAPEEDRIMAPKNQWASFQEFVDSECDSDDEEDMNRTRFENIQRDIARQVPFAMHRSPSGGRIAYLGFVNGDGNIPNFVRALCTGNKVAVS